MKLRSRLTQNETDQLLDYALELISNGEWIEAGTLLEKGIIEAIDASPFKVLREQVFTDAPEQIQHGKVRYHLDAGRFDDAEKALQSLKNISTPDYQYTVADLEANLRKRRLHTENSIFNRVKADEDAVEHHVVPTDTAVNIPEDTARAVIDPLHAPFLPPELAAQAKSLNESTQATRTVAFKPPIVLPSGADIGTSAAETYRVVSNRPAVQPRSNIALFFVFLLLSGVFIAIGIGILLALTRPDLTPVINAVIPQLTPDVQVVIVDSTGNPFPSPSPIPTLPVVNASSVTPFTNDMALSAATPFGNAGALQPDLTAIAEMSLLDGPIPTAVAAVTIPPTITVTVSPTSTVTPTAIATLPPALVNAITFSRYDAESRAVMAFIPAEAGYLARSLVEGDGLLIWSPSGERFAYADDESIHIQDAAGTLIRMLRYPEGCTRPSVQWSPDGTELLVACGSASLFALSVQSEGAPRTVINLLPNRAGIIDVVVSPDGKRMIGCFDNGSEASLNLILISESFGASVNALTPDALSAYIFPESGNRVDTQNFECGDVAWSPDSQHIAFAARGTTLGHEDWDIYTAVVPEYNLSQNQRFLTNVQNITVQNAGDDLDPTWSKDGKLAYSAEQDTGQFDILLRTVDGAVENLTSSPAANERHPDWQP